MLNYSYNYFHLSSIKYCKCVFKSKTAGAVNASIFQPLHVVFTVSLSVPGT